MAIPRLCGYYKVWGILQLLALEPVGAAIPESGSIDGGLRKKMKVALRHIHNAGHVHGDIGRPNFCMKPGGQVFSVDLGVCRPACDQSELRDEMKEVGGL